MAQPATTDLQLSRSKRTGIIVLISLLVLLLALWHLLPLWLAPAPAPERKQLQAAWEQFKEEHAIKSGTSSVVLAEEETPYKTSKDRDITLFPFDPNTASKQDLIRLGIPPGTAKTLVKYRSKGGKFYKTEDLRKLYTLKPADYERLAPFVRIAGADPKAFEREDRAGVTYTKAAQQIELNTADAESLMRLRGIGPAFAKRILHYRDALGGFVSVGQLKEVYGFPDSVYQQLSAGFTVDIKKIKLINVNTATEAELAQHPYIRHWLASDIIKLRNDLKSFTEIVQIRQVPLINEEKYRKIAPYLSTH